MAPSKSICTPFKEPNKFQLHLLPHTCSNPGKLLCVGLVIQALGKAGPSMILSLVREIIFGVFLPILLPRVFGLDGVLYAFPTADILTFILTMVVIGKVYRELSAGNVLENTAGSRKGCPSLQAP